MSTGSETQNHTHSVSAATVLNEWNAALRAYPRDSTVHECFVKRAIESPAALAAIEPADSGTRRLTYQQLNEASNAVADALLSHQVKPGDCIGLYASRSLETVVGMLGVLKSGAAYVPLDPDNPPERNRLILEDTGARVVLTQQALVDEFDFGIAQKLCVDSLAPTSELVNVRVDALAPAYVMYTSGSTGRPKGAVIPHRAINRLVHNSDFLRFDSSLVTAHLASPAFDAATFEIWGPLLHGGHLVILPKEVTLSAAAVHAELSKHQVNSIFLTSVLFSHLVQDDPTIFAGLDTVMFGGDATNPRWVKDVLQNLPPRRLVNVYGPTETTTFAAWHLVKEIPEDAVTVPIGRPIGNTQLYVLDEHLAPVTPGRVGELYIGGDGLALGYLNDSQLSAERFVPNPFAPAIDASRLYKTGDLVSQAADGAISFRGRADFQVKIRGHRIELVEIELALSRISWVRDAVVVVTELDGDKRLLGYVVLAAGAEQSAMELRAALAETLPPYMLPANFVRLATLPLNANGKLDRSQLAAAPQQQFGPVSSFRDATTDEERLVVQACMDVLGSPRINLYDCFLDLGGHSLAAMRVLVRIEERTGLRGKIGDLLTAESLAQFAANISEWEPATKTTAAHTQVSDPSRAPLTFQQEQIWFLGQIAPDSVAYNTQVTLHLDGPLNVATLEQACSQIVQRHQIFRTTFHADDGVPFQKLNDSWQVKIPVTDLSNHPLSDREQAIAAALSRQFSVAFDTTQLPLVRWSLLRLSADEHLLVQVEHHFVHDGWSLSLLLGELNALYQAAANNKAPELNPVATQYMDYARWQHDRLQGKHLNSLTDYWQHQLADLPEPPDLDADYPRSNAIDFSGDGIRFELPESLYRALQQFSRDQKTTLFVTMLAAFKLLLFTRSGEQDQVVGTGVANRNERRFENTIGMMVNTIVLRSTIQSSQPFVEYLQQLNDAALSGYAHQELPLEFVVRAVNPERKLQRNPLFQTMFSFHDSQVPDIDFGGIRGVLTERHNGSAKTDLNVVVIPRSEQRLGQHRRSDMVTSADSAVVIWEYDTTLFKPETVNQMVATYQAILQVVVASPGAALGALLRQVGVPVQESTTAPDNAAAAIASVESVSPICTHPQLEQQLSLMWEELLAGNPVGPEDDFFDSGGHSLLAVRVLSRIEQQFGVKVSLVDFFDEPTVRAMATHIAVLTETD